MEDNSSSLYVEQDQDYRSYSGSERVPSSHSGGILRSSSAHSGGMVRASSSHSSGSAGSSRVSYADMRPASSHSGAIISSSVDGNVVHYQSSDAGVSHTTVSSTMYRTIGTDDTNVKPYRVERAIPAYAPGSTPSSFVPHPSWKSGTGSRPGTASYFRCEEVTFPCRARACVWPAIIHLTCFLFCRPVSRNSQKNKNSILPTIGMCERTEEHFCASASLLHPKIVCDRRPWYRLAARDIRVGTSPQEACQSGEGAPGAQEYIARRRCVIMCVCVIPLIFFKITAPLPFDAISHGADKTSDGGR
jgi:hypothetical protein